MLNINAKSNTAKDGLTRNKEIISDISKSFPFLNIINNIDQTIFMSMYSYEFVSTSDRNLSFRINTSNNFKMRKGRWFYKGIMIKNEENLFKYLNTNEKISIIYNQELFKKMSNWNIDQWTYFDEE